MISEALLVAGVRTPIGSMGGVLSTVPATELGATCIKAALEKAGVPADEVERSHHGQRRRCRAGPEPGPPGGDQGRPAGVGRRHDDQQGVRVRAQVGDAGDPDDPARLLAGRRGRRHGEHEPGPYLLPQARAGLPHGQRRAGRLDDPRRPVGRVRRQAHGHVRRPVCARSTASPSRTRTTSPSAATRGPAGPRPKACSTTRSCRSRSRARRARPRSPKTRSRRGSTRRSCGRCGRRSAARAP